MIVSEIWFPPSWNPNRERRTSRLYLSPCFFNLYAEYIIQNAGLDEEQAEIKTVRRNINNFRYGDDITLMAESKEELKSLLMKVKEESEKAGLKFQIQKTKIMASSPITSWQIDEETTETVTDFILGGSKITGSWKKQESSRKTSISALLTMPKPLTAGSQ